MKKILTLITSIILLCNFSHAQQTGKVTFESLGIEFMIPNGWVGQLMEDSYIIGHQSEPGFILLTTHEASSLDELKQTAQAGLYDQANGIMLQMEGQTEIVGNNGIGATFTGNMGGQPAKAYVLGLVNSYGSGVSIMSAISEAQYSTKYKELALQVARSVTFTQPVAPPVADNWKNNLANTRLTYMDSYSSITYSDPNVTTGGGYSNKEVIDLCGEGYFKYSKNNEMSVTGGANVSGLQTTKGRGAGTWEVRADASGNPLLVLNFYSGEVYEYAITNPDRKLHLNGYRYYHTWTGENKPDCF